MSDLVVTIKYGDEVDAITVSNAGIMEMLNGQNVSDQFIVDWAKDNMKRIVREQVVGVLVGPAVEQFIQTHVSEQS